MIILLSYIWMNIFLNKTYIKGEQLTFNAKK